MKQILAIETSLADGSVALIQQGELQTGSFQSDRLHNADLFPALEELLPARKKLALDLIIVGTGPGSYNGSRIAIAAAQGISLTYGCPVVGLPSFLAVPSVAQGKTHTFIGDARRQSYFAISLAQQRVQGDLQLLESEEFSTHWEQFVSPFTFEDPARLPLSEEQKKMITLKIPQASELINVWHQMDPEEQASFLKKSPQPFYLRPPHITKTKKKRRY